ncbi:MAG: transposase [Candidatus Atribacteria bacterium]|nr:transposase [Candidatus Atribacteria bacterium]
MKIQNAKQDIQKLLSCFSEAFSRPSFKIFSSFITGFIRLGKEAHTSSMVQSLTYPFLHRSVSSFTRFLGQNIWTLEEVAEIALEQFFHTLRIKTHSVLFLIIDDTIAQKSGKKIPGCAWHRDHTQKAFVFGHQWVLSALLYKDFLLPLWAKLYPPKGTKGCGRFQTKITIAQKIIQGLRFPLPCKLYVLADSWYWAKTLANVCRKYGYHMISQLKSTSVLWMNGKKTKVTILSTLSSAYREVSLFLYGKNKTLKIARFVGVIQGLGKVAVVVVKEKRKKTSYLVSTNLHLSAMDIIKYYAKRWKIEQMIKDLKQRLGLGDYQVRNLQAIQRHVALSLLSYTLLILLKILQWLRDQTVSLDVSIRLLAFQVRRYILLKHITVTLNRMKVEFNQSLLDIYLEKLWA